MKKIILLFILLCGFLSSAVASNTVLIDAQKPGVTIFYASLFDQICEAKTSYKIDPMWIQDLLNQLPHWKKLWNHEGNLLLEKTIKLIKRPFVQHDFQVALSLCSFPSMSAPLLVNSRYALQSYY